MTVATEEAPTTTTKRKINISPESKQASALRRDAAMLTRLAAGSSDPKSMLALAASKLAQAEQLAPAANVGRAPKDLTESEWSNVEGYFLADLRPRLREGFSVKKLKTIAAANPQA